MCIYRCIKKWVPTPASQLSVDDKNADLDKILPISHPISVLGFVHFCSIAILRMPSTAGASC
jgi:hypothetical protein